LKTLVYFEQFATIQDAIQREQALAACLEGSVDRRDQSGVERPVRDHLEVKTWMAGTSPAMTRLFFRFNSQTAEGM
jgi:hypothetical protein